MYFYLPVQVFTVENWLGLVFGLRGLNLNSKNVTTQTYL